MLPSRAAWFLAVSLCALACGRTRAVTELETETKPEEPALVPSTPSHQSGTRLRARYFVADDGARQVERLDAADPLSQVWFDSLLETPCTLEKFGTDYLCVPLTPLTAWTNPYGSDLCKGLQPIASFRADTFGLSAAASQLTLPLRDALCGQRRYAVTRTPEDPLTPPRVFELGAPLALTDWRDPDPLCENAVPRDTAAAFALTRELKPSELATGRLQHTATGRRLSLDQVVTDDGARQSIGYFDDQLQLECVSGLGADQKRHCVPKTQGMVRASPRFLDAECHDSTYVTADPVARGALVTRSVDTTYLAAPLEVYRIESLPSTLYWFINGVCVAVPPDAQVSPVLMMTEIKPSAMVAFFDHVDQRAELEVVSETDAEGSPSLVLSRVVDPESGELCRFALLDDGQTHCIARAERGIFTDEACETRGALRATVDEGEPPPHYAADWSGDACSGGLSLFELGPASPQRFDFFYRDVSGNCSHDGASGYMSSGTYSVGQSVPAAGFIAAQSLVE